jgi:integrase
MTSSSNKLNLTTKTSTSNWISHRRVQFAPLSMQAGQAKRVEKIIPHTPIVPDSTHSFIERRATQVNEMIAGKVKMKSTTMIEPWKEASPKILQLWKDRHPAYQNFSSHYMASQRRMLFLADVNPSDRFEAFETICFKRNLAPTTAETYWSTWLGIQKALVIKPSDADHRITKILKARSMAYPVQFPTPITLSEMDLLVSTFDVSLPSLAAIAMTTFLLGQRISDMIQLAVADLKSNDDYLTITVRRGKTMQVTTPYSLWLRRKTYPTETLIELAGEIVRSTLSLHEPQFGRGTTTSITHSSRYVDEHKRSTRIAKSSTRRPSKDGASRCEHSDDASLLSSLRCADADAIPFLGSTCDASSESDDRSRRHDDERDEHFGADSIGGDVDDAMMNSILPRFSDESRLRGQNRLRLFAKRPTQIATVEDQAFPLHIQNPPVAGYPQDR